MTLGVGVLVSVTVGVGLDVGVDQRAGHADLGLEVGILPTGPLNAITDVPGMLVGHSTVIRGDSVRTGVTAIVPEAVVTGDAPGPHRIPAAVFVGNAFGKLMGSTRWKNWASWKPRYC